MTIKDEMEKMIKRKKEKDESFEAFTERKYKRHALSEDIEAFEIHLREKKNREVDEIIKQLKIKNNID